MDWSSISAIGGPLLEALLPVLSSVLVIAITVLVKKGIDKLGVSRSVQIDAMIDKYVAIGVNTAERVAANKLNTSESLNGSSKLSLATKTVLDELKQSGITDVAEELIKARIESFLEVKTPKGK